jgi:hypothetical protein
MARFMTIAARYTNSVEDSTEFLHSTPHLHVRHERGEGTVSPVSASDVCDTADPHPLALCSDPRGVLDDARVTRENPVAPPGTDTCHGDRHDRF